jgi:hypothetical protein
VGVQDDPVILACVEQARRRWPDLVIRLHAPLPQPLTLSAEGRAVPVLPIEHVAADGPDGLAALAAWAGLVSSSAGLTDTWQQARPGT